MSLLNYIIELIDDNIDGSLFFDSIDDYVRNNKDILNKISSMSSYSIICSGKMAQSMIDAGINVVVVTPGGIRKSRQIDLTPQKSEITGKVFSFIDDSYYRGRTYRKIKKEITRLGGSIAEVIVAYDGDCLENEVISLVKYRDLEKRRK